MEFTPQQETVNVPVQALKNPTAALEHEVELMKQRFKWMAVSWWVMFVLLALVAFGSAGLTLWNTRDVRDETLANTAILSQRIDSNSMDAGKRLQDQASVSGNRMDQILRDYADLRAEMTALQMDFDHAEQICTLACNAAGK